MKTSNIGNIAVEIPNTKKEKFNFNHDNNTTYDWGSVQPILAKMMQPDSTINVEDEQLIRLAPMVVPTFGRIKIKNIAHFVPIQEIFPNWDALLTQTKVTRSAISNGCPAASTYIPKNTPFISNSILAAWCLAGAKANFYYSGDVGTIDEDTWYNDRNIGTWGTPGPLGVHTEAIREYMFKILGIENSSTPTTSTLTQLKYTGFIWNPNEMLRNNQTQKTLLNGYGWMALRMPTITTMTEVKMANANGTGYTHSASNEQNMADLTIGDTHVSFEGADMIWEYRGKNNTGILATERSSTAGTSPLEGITHSDFDGKKIRIVFKLSSFGKRFRKILIGLRYDCNLSNNDNVSILPLVAYYKAYWDSYAPERTKNFYETYAWKLVQATLVGQAAADLQTQFNNSSSYDIKNYFTGFMGELGTCFATEKVDVISAATDDYYNQTENANTALQTDIATQVMTAIDEILENPINSNNADGSSTSNVISKTSDNSETKPFGQYFINLGTNKRLGQPEIRALKEAYIMLNKNSVAGQTVADILRANGQGDYVEECNGKFLDSSEDAIKISDVVATAATADASLGQYGGRGLGMTKLQFSYNTGRWGYLIVLSTIIPESGYINSPAHENEAISYDKIYNPQLDGLAYEAIQKKALGGSPLINDKTYANTFGYLPTYTQWKFMSNKANGDFSLNSRKKYMMPYTLDKYIPTGDPNVYKVIANPSLTGSTMELCSPTFTYADLANAGEDYRYVNKFPWNGNYNRIFEADGDGIEWSVFSPNNNAFLFNAFEYDNFMVHNVFLITYMAHMKSIEKSYGTYDEEHAAPDTTIKRS